MPSKRLQKTGAEKHIALEHLDYAEVRDLLDIDAFYRLLGEREPSASDAVLRQFCEQDMVCACDDGHYAITNLGALLLARRLSDFSGLRKRAIRVIRYAGSGFARMSKSDRMDATYWHACLMYAQSESMSNQTLRERFGLPAETKSTVAISRLLRECCDAELIHEEDSDSGARYRRYVPFWA